MSASVAALGEVVATIGSGAGISSIISSTAVWSMSNDGDSCCCCSSSTLILLGEEAASDGLSLSLFLF
ncbi:ORF1188 [White spot syndrome virus]|uniref:ORF1188 n=1 Tax=White spot syndrome virus TaxID=342409 RepID=A0A2D3I6P1_9VIRU|nr:ORF1188 [White spot syndrome virus]